MPSTRASARASASPSKARNSQGKKALVSDTESSGDEINIDVEEHLGRAQEGVKIFLKKLRSLRETNAELTAELESLRDSKDTSKAGSSKATLQAQVRELEGEVRRLGKARRKDKEKLEKHKTMELKREAEDLGDSERLSVDDTAHDMRKLLRRFHDLMTINVIDNDECPICFDKLELKKCSSLPCQHLVCNDCLHGICKVNWKERSEGEQGKEVMVCPQCRDEAPRDDLELIQYTPTQQWDALLEVAGEWANLDRRRPSVGTSDEEDEEEFINDNSTNASSSASSEAPDASKESTPESDMHVDRAVTPPASVVTQPQSNGPRRYLDSPARAKRKRMEELAEERRTKKHL